MLGMMPQKKKIASVILSSKGLDGKTKEEAQPEVQNDDSVGMEAAAGKIISAFEAKDSKALVEGLKDFLAMVELDEEMSGEE
jgi:co-chaperonin GroES (HSP10)